MENQSGEKYIYDVIHHASVKIGADLYFKVVASSFGEAQSLYAQYRSETLESGNQAVRLTDIIIDSDVIPYLWERDVSDFRGSALFINEEGEEKVFRC